MMHIFYIQSVGKTVERKSMTKRSALSLYSQSTIGHWLCQVFFRWATFCFLISENRCLFCRFLIESCLVRFSEVDITASKCKAFKPFRSRHEVKIISTVTHHVEFTISFKELFADWVIHLHLMRSCQPSSWLISVLSMLSKQGKTR